MMVRRSWILTLNRRQKPSGPPVLEVLVIPIGPCTIEGSHWNIPNRQVVPGFHWITNISWSGNVSRLWATSSWGESFARLLTQLQIGIGTLVWFSLSLFNWVFLFDPGTLRIPRRPSHSSRGFETVFQSKFTSFTSITAFLICYVLNSKWIDQIDFLSSPQSL